MPKSAPTPADNNAPIGLFDSGVGGLSVYLHLQARLPQEQFIYYADTKNVPYGEKSSDDIRSYTETAVAWLISQGAKLIVVACNSASAYTLTQLREKYHIPIVGLVPAIKPACYHSKTGKIAVLATRATLNSTTTQALIDSIATPMGITVYQHFEPKLVPWVEDGAPIDHQVADLLIAQMYRWLDDGVDTLVLGCTHYPFFRTLLQMQIDRHGLPMTLIDSGLAIADRVASLLPTHPSGKPSIHAPRLRFYASGDTPKATVARLISLPVDFVNAQNHIIAENLATRP